jgi:hypothetical protein
MDKKSFDNVDFGELPTIKDASFRTWIKCIAWDTSSHKVVSTGVFFDNSTMQLKTIPQIRLLFYTVKSDSVQNDIYEGHIVSLKDSKRKFTIRYNCEKSQWYLYDFVLRDWSKPLTQELAYDLTIIGHMYSNPELLEDK